MNISDAKQENINIGRKLQQYRLERGISQQEMAKRLAISRSGYSDYERGKCKISLEMLIKMSSVFRVTPNRLSEILQAEFPQYNPANTDSTDLKIATKLFIEQLKIQDVFISGQALSNNDLKLFETLINNAVNVIELNKKG